MDLLLWKWKEPKLTPNERIRLANHVREVGLDRMFADYLGFTKADFLDVHGIGLLFLLFAIVCGAMAINTDEASRVVMAQPAVAATLGLIVKYGSLLIAGEKQKKWLQQLVNDVPANAQETREAQPWECEACAGSGTEKVKLARNSGVLFMPCKACSGTGAKRKS